ncbi:MAG: VCBS repeat-containing protein [Myxococcales bacterium]|nr:VCBS repeat-containing protein [Myxococcales bacterium]
MVAAVAAALVAGCGGGGGGGGDAAIVDADTGSETPPFDAPPPVCLASAGVPCRECLIGPPRAASASQCTLAVCAVDPSCCDSGWDERCTEHADALCDARCVDTVSFGGYDSATWARWGGAGFVDPGELLLTDADGYVADVAWADYDGDGDADLAAVSQCTLRVYRNDGWAAGELQLEPVFAGQPVTPCGYFSDGGSAFWDGRRVRWVDLDRDGDLDLLAAGATGGYVSTLQAGAFQPLVHVVDGTADGAGDLTDVAPWDLDDDGDLDLVAGYFDGDVAVIRRQNGAWVVDAAAAIARDGVTSLAFCDVTGDARRELVVGGFGGDDVYRISNGSPGQGLWDLVGVDASVVALACADLDGDGKDEVVLADRYGEVLVVDADGATLWSSADALDPTRTWEPWGIDAGDLDGDGDVDLVFSIDRNDPPEPFHVLWNTTAGGGAITFTDLDAGDLDPDRDMRLAELTWLGAP